MYIVYNMYVDSYEYSTRQESSNSEERTREAFLSISFSGFSSIALFPEGQTENCDSVKKRECDESCYLLIPAGNFSFRRAGDMRRNDLEQRSPIDSTRVTLSLNHTLIVWLHNPYVPCAICQIWFSINHQVVRHGKYIVFAMCAWIFVSWHCTCERIKIGLLVFYNTMHCKPCITVSHIRNTYYTVALV